MPAKKPKVTDWRIIAMSGKTADGREISARHLQEMASQYNPEKYAARINLEHLRFIFPYPEVTGYGDVVELKAEKQADGKTALLAKLAVNDNLQELWDADQKVFSSIEIHPDFSDTGKAYLVGVAVTDSPASLGTTRHFSVSGAEAVAATQSIQFSEYTEMSESAKKAQSRPVCRPLSHLCRQARRIARCRAAARGCRPRSAARRAGNQRRAKRELCRLAAKNRSPASRVRPSRRICRRAAQAI